MVVQMLNHYVPLEYRAWSTTRVYGDEHTYYTEWEIVETVYYDGRDCPAYYRLRDNWGNVTQHSAYCTYKQTEWVLDSFGLRAIDTEYFPH